MHDFNGKWITDPEFSDLKPRNVFHRQLDRTELPCDEHRDRHILFRKEFVVGGDFSDAVVYISADDYYKLYINGEFVAQGPAPSYHFRYNYNRIPVAKFLKAGENVIAVHTLYQGLINRVWQSGDNRHGLILDLEWGGKVRVCSDETFKTCPHSGYRETGTVGYDTQFMEEYDSRSKQVGFQLPGYDDSGWENASYSRYDDHELTEQKSKMLVFERINPVSLRIQDNKITADFGSVYVGYLNVTAKGPGGGRITVRCGQELNEDQSVRFELRANCRYEEDWILSGNNDRLDWFDYKSFRYAELVLPDNAEVEEIYLTARHYPFQLKTELRAEYRGNEKLKKIWKLCVNSQKYGVQEAILDCMEREKGFYLGDGCYTALANFILTKDDGMVRKIIDDAFASAFITDGLVTCLDCSFMQEIAEYPLILVYLIYWHYRLTGDVVYLEGSYRKATKLLEAYRRDYEKDYLLRDLDKWCVVEWPRNFRHGYDVDISEGKVCHQPHISINAYYIEAIKTLNKMAEILGEAEYRDISPLNKAFITAFYDRKEHLFRDGLETEHKSLIGNIFPFAFEILPDKEFSENIQKMILENGISSVSLFCAFLTLEGFVRAGKKDIIGDLLSDSGAWLRTIREDGKMTFEGWGRETKQNASLFHMTMSYGAVFLADIDLENLFCI